MFVLTLFIVGTANYYNFMDGINGIAGITGVIGFGLLSFYSYSFIENSSISILSLCLSFCCLGFLPFNFPRAKVFMGDVGSILLGFIFAAIVILLSRSVKDFVCLSSFLFPFYADEITTELRRLKNGEKIWLPHRKHFYQLLANEYAIPHWKISLGYGIGQILVGLSILYFFDSGLLAILLIFFLYFVIYTLLSGFMRKRLIQKQGS
jgi:Fuc2NAc and GlcNAc transferase